MYVEGWCNVLYKWLSLHAGVAIKGDDRDGLKRLFRYAARSSVSLSQLSYMTPEDPDRSDVELHLKRRWRDGTDSLIFKQKDLVEKLASLVPPSWFNLTRYYGVFASAHVWRDFIVQSIVPGVKRKRSIYPAHDDPGDGTPPPPGKPSAGGRRRSIGCHGRSFFGARLAWIRRSADALHAWWWMTRSLRLRRLRRY